ncbi:hypothetical protein HMH01_14440 [Halovulum dunhuangense]|uniref:Uncharacterized protein n=1 Tax=Halovulum dunhuangense TaxID=1505036 RepID=A0A849L5J7_9RHOB|nr:hypothetical protein [Halovulum dunhuangense]NNU81636.1 hypothetical protein [Halovulum dunhuangense]
MGDTQARRFEAGDWVVLGFTLAYGAGFTSWFLARGNLEFMVYVGTMMVFIGLLGLSLRTAAWPRPMLWALSAWGLAHMAGGAVPVNGSVLYALQLVPLVSEGEMTILKYDQLVHAYGFGVTAWLLWHLMARHFPDLRGTTTIRVYPVLGAMGLGSFNEMIEFAAVLSVPETHVGGYVNTSLDLVFNAAGAMIAMLVIAARDK